MINEKEIESITLSACHKDFYQIWNELLDTASKLSERWDPTSTNESDPGIVLLKVLTAIADKLNYTIDKNTLEAFMPSAAQEDSMRKLCDMMGYTMKYYQSATTDVTISYIGSTTIEEKVGADNIMIPKYTNIKNTDGDINYFTTDNITLTDLIKTKEIECIEGELVDCGEDTDKIISVNQLDDSNRYFLPESQIAENGIFITNITDNNESNLWEKVDNLNTQKVGKQCYKFGFDSKQQMPYVQFPEDIATIIEDGLHIKYTRTNGINGNISYNTLNTLELSSTLDEAGFSSSDFAVKNSSAAMNGKNKESLNDAYNNYKKTIGTFDTLVTCRDYMNKIYQMTTSDANQTPLVSNVIVSDIRDDINRAITLCTFNEYGIAYVDSSLKETNSSNKIEHFDLVLYPFTTISGTATASTYKNSFKYTTTNKTEIEENLKKNKTISHKIVYPNDNEIVLIKNYLKLKAKITTTAKVTAIEEAYILSSIYSAIYENFNARKIDFGEEIPFDTILEVIQNADYRIKNVSLEEPILYTRILNVNGDESIETFSVPANFNKLALRNVFAGRLPLFDYNEDFKPSFDEKKYTGAGIEPIYPSGSTKIITKLESDFNIYPQNNEVVLNENEVVQFRAPNFKTTKTYPAYVNYFFYAGPNKSKIIKSKTDYELTGDEWLAINYTPSITNDDGSTGSGDPINIVYKAGEIIRPNFDLYDSIEWRTTHTPSKKDGYDDMPQEQKDIINSDANKKGMFSFSADQQVEIRGKVEVVLDDQVTNIYWERNDEDTLEKSVDGKYLYFEWNEDPVDPTQPISASNPGLAYTLKEGEYVYYTDEAKIDLAYYGNGTKIVRQSADIKLYKVKTEDSEALADKIANEGLLASLPWVSFDCRGTKKLTLQEYQYVNLTAGDTIKKINNITGIDAKITKDWSTHAAITQATYRLNGADTDSELSEMSIVGANWVVRSILNINSAPTVIQTLHSVGDGTEAGIKTENIITVYYKNIATPDIIKPVYNSSLAAYDNLSFKTNYLAQTSTGTLNISSDLTDFKLETFEIEKIDRINFGNFSNSTWTKISAEELEDGKKFNVNLHNSDHGMWMIYYISPTSTEKNQAYITISEPTTATINICNAINGGAKFEDNGWWKGYYDAGARKYYLKPGINIIEIPGSCSLTLQADTEKKSVLIFSNLDIIKYDTNHNDLLINPRIDYKAIDKATATKQIMYDLYQIDPDYNFYYNAVIDNSIAIDFNTNITDPDDADYEKLSSPRIWYDYNNINNKFVISEIDADYLLTGITLANASRK